MVNILKYSSLAAKVEKPARCCNKSSKHKIISFLVVLQSERYRKLDYTIGRGLRLPNARCGKCPYPWASERACVVWAFAGKSPYEIGETKHEPAVRSRTRPGYHQQPRHRVRPRGPQCRHGSEGAAPAFSQGRLGGA